MNSRNYICREKLENKYPKDKKYFYYAGEYEGVAHSICNLKYSIPIEITIRFHKRSNNDYQFIIK